METRADQNARRTATMRRVLEQLRAKIDERNARQLRAVVVSKTLRIRPRAARPSDRCLAA